MSLLAQVACLGWLTPFSSLCHIRNVTGEGHRGSYCVHRCVLVFCDCNKIPAIISLNRGKALFISAHGFGGFGPLPRCSGSVVWPGISVDTWWKKLPYYGDWKAKRERKGHDPSSAFQAVPPVTSLPPSRPHPLKVPPPSSSAKGCRPSL